MEIDVTDVTVTMATADHLLLDLKLSKVNSNGLTMQLEQKSCENPQCCLILLVSN